MSTPPFDFVSTELVDRLVMAHDASLYRLVPTAVARPRTRDEVIALLHWADQHQQHLTFRAAGTSLSGQAVTDGILVDLSRHWHHVEIMDDGERVRVAPGVTGGRVNVLLAPYGKKLGPDPASLNAAMIGGIVANNASGMCCGTVQNSYHTVESMKIILADGWSFDSADQNADVRLRTEQPAVYDAVCSLRDEIRANEELSALIRRKYRIKNTIGYSLNAFLDEDRPSQILMRLMVGSEGTLGFIEEVTYRTVADARQKWTSIFVYDSLQEACATVPMWTTAGAAAVELMDDASLRSFAGLSHTPEHLRITTPGAAALLVEYHGTAPNIDGNWTTDAAEQALLWKLRKGLMPTVGAMRPAGSTMINEDIAVPPEHLASLVADVQQAFIHHGYSDGIIFGHAKDGNIHFVINQDFSAPSEVERYGRFMDAIADIVVEKYQGSLKAEHGTGRNMAPYVEQEWGSAAFALMQRLKIALDPKGILNPDVVISADKNIHLKNIKPVPIVDTEVNACIECGFCEHVCPTRTTTLSPRQRIVLRREILSINDPHVVSQLLQAEGVQSIDSCAVDSMCSVVCPVHIDTGQLVKNVRSSQHSSLMKGAAGFVADHWGLVDAVAPRVLRLRHTDSTRSTNRPTSNTQRVLFLPSCPSRWTSPDLNTIRNVAARAGIELIIPENTRSLCCGQPFSSKGFTVAAEHQLKTAIETLSSQTDDTSIPIVTDTSTCASALIRARSWSEHPIMTPNTFIEQMVLPSLTITRRAEHVVLHPGCGTHHTGDTERMRMICERVSERVTIPSTAFCCGQAGNHGNAHPEIPDGALRIEAQEVRSLNADLHVSNNTMCQSALARRTETPWISIFDLLDRVSS